MGCVDAGSLKHRIVVEQSARESDEMGGSTLTWSTFATLWASITPMKAGEVFWAKHLEHRVTHKIMIRYYEGITAAMRISFDSRYFHVKAVRNIDEKNEWMELVAEEGVAT
jgi:SPP1 family predicted phage head-tail adaptor